MKYRPIFDLQECPQSSRAWFDVAYFNGRFVAAVNTPMLRALVELNEAKGCKFNSMFTIMLDAEQQKVLKQACQEGAESAMFALSERLPLEGRVILRFNPQMAYLITKFLDNSCGLCFQFDMNWIGASILTKMCLKSDKDTYVLGHCLEELMDTMQQRQAEWQASNEDEAPRGYVTKKRIE